MKAYSYDYNGILIGSFEAELCPVTEMRKQAQAVRPLEEGEEYIESIYLLPAFSTLKEPASELGAGYQWKFMNGDWYASEIPVPEVKPEEQPEPEVVLTYADKRAMEYPSAYEYLDGIVKSHQEATHNEGVAQIEAYIEKCLEVKAKYPKPI